MATWLDYKKMTADEYVKYRIMSKMMEKRNALTKSAYVGRVVWCAFDKEKFDKRLIRKIKKMYGIKLDLKPYWDRYFACSDLYIQRDFLEKSYGYKFRKFGIYRDYGVVIFYANNIQTNPKYSKDLIKAWFYNTVYRKYIEALKWYSRFSVFSRKTFEFYVRWKPICDAAIYFDKNISAEDVKNQIVMLSEKEGLSIKAIDDYEVVFG